MMTQKMSQKKLSQKEKIPSHQITKNMMKTKKRRMKMAALRSIKTKRPTGTSKPPYSHTFRQFKSQVKVQTGEHMITEKNEWGDYKVKALQIKQLEKDVDQVDLNKSVSHFPYNYVFVVIVWKYLNVDYRIQMMMMLLRLKRKLKRTRKWLKRRIRQKKRKRVRN